MRYVTALFAALVLSASPAFAAYDVSVTIPRPDKPAECQLYVDGVKQGAPRACGVAQAYARLLPADGTYVLRYTFVQPDYESALSPVTTLTTDDGRPSDPTAPLNAVVTCNPAPCPQNVTITISP